MKKYLASDAQIIHSAEFDSAVVKIVPLVESTLTHVTEEEKSQG
jgi:hypothetical protein